MDTHRELEKKYGDHFSTLIPLIAIIITILQIIFLIWRFSSWYYDDPFITYRYAWNLIHGMGLVYNPGERVLSTTTPFFAVLLAGFGYYWSDLPKLATIIGCLSTGISGLVFWELARQWKLNFASWVGLLLIPTFPLIETTISSETPVYILLVLLTLNCYVHRRYWLLAVFASLLVLIRPDGILLPLLLVIFFLSKKVRHIPWGAVGLFIAITALWYGFIWVYFGSPLPTSLLTKQQQGVMSISQLFAPVFFQNSALYAQKWYYILEGLLALIGIIGLFIRRQSSLILVIWSVLYFIAYTLLRVTGYFWYYAPLVPGFIFMVGAGFQFIYEYISRNLRPRITMIWLESVLLTGMAILWVFQGVNSFNYSLSPDKKYTVYRSIGEWLNKYTNKNARIGTLESGIIGYFSERPVIDFAGLIQPAVAEQMRIDSTYEDTARWAISKFHPSYIVSYLQGFPNLRAEYLNKECQVVQYFNRQDYNSPQDMVIYQCDRGN